MRRPGHAAIVPTSNAKDQPCGGRRGSLILHSPASRLTIPPMTQTEFARIGQDSGLAQWGRVLSLGKLGLDDSQLLRQGNVQDRPGDREPAARSEASSLSSVTFHLLCTCMVNLPTKETKTKNLVVRRGLIVRLRRACKRHRQAGLSARSRGRLGGRPCGR